MKLIALASFLLGTSLLGSQPASAAPLDGEEIFSITQEQPKQAAVQPTPAPTPAPAIQKTKKPAKATAPAPAPQPQGNLPFEFIQRDQKALQKTSSVTVLPGAIKGKLKGIKVGDIIFGRVLHSILAFPNEKAPVVAQVTDGPFKGARLLGASRLEPNSKRIFIDFTAITSGGETYDFLASAVTEDGTTGFKGEYHSQEAAYFTGDFIASFTAAYFDGLVPRSTNVFGVMTEDTSPESAMKKGVAGGAMATAERFKEKLKRVPEFSELRGPFDIGILIINSGVQK
jgi:hypothetical protein